VGQKGGRKEVPDLERLIAWRREAMSMERSVFQSPPVTNR
jgi:hypothetical protein